MRHGILTLLCGLGVILSGCIDRTGKATAFTPVSGERHEVSEPFTGDLWVIYHPWVSERAFTLSHVRPSPFYQDWADQRMQRDLSRMSEVGISGVLVRLTPQELTQPERRGRFMRFCELAQAHDISAALYLVPDSSQSPLQLRRANLRRFLDQQGMSSLPGGLQHGGRSVVILSEDILLDAQSADDPPGSLLLWRIGDELPPFPAGKNLSDALTLSSADFLWVRAADNNGCFEITPDVQRSHWKIPRSKAKFIEQLQFAVEHDVSVILLDSWNDYTRGSFIEHNTFDGGTMLDILSAFKEKE